MAKLTDLPAELVNSIVHLVIYPTPPPMDPSDIMWRIHPHHLSSQLSGSLQVQPQSRPHQDGIILDDENNYPEDYPKNPLLPLCLVNRIFCQCAQELLFKNVSLKSKWTASLFLNSLTCVPPHDDQSYHTRRQNDDDNQLQAMQAGSPHVYGLSQHVRSLQFSWGKECSMGQGGGSMFCKIIQSCPLLENIAISNTFLLACKEPILNALASQPRIKEFVILKNTRREHSTFQWQAHEVVSHLFSQWDSLETVELSGLACWPDDSPEPAPASIPTFNCTIRTMILKDHDLDPLTLSNLLMSCGESMRTLTITGPGYKLDRASLCWILQECTSPNLESLMLKSIYWDPSIHPDLNSEDPTFNPALLDIMFNSPTAFKNLKILSFDGRMATAKLLERLPQSLLRLSWEGCELPASALIKALLSPEGTQGSLPNLKCCSYLTSIQWEKRDEWKIVDVLKMRGGCSHSIIHRGFPPIFPHGDTDIIQYLSDD
ncbi:hypothetical protein PCASD_02955 [Puccinia coronata f. sp. avenae]|uniref:F-box domain-containing protein n=1 Tax=Puccinia coronata f. sp. avenae TaxID=200324 RepID=A0A2N5VEA7_9BASI|nr:hypothetical protein PCASD_02955 [Puccinia coronata f. sp. avenae]